MSTVRFVIHHVRTLLPTTALIEEEIKSSFFFTVLDQTLSEIRFHVGSVV
jgi:hypothetical protein